MHSVNSGDAQVIERTAPILFTTRSEFVIGPMQIAASASCANISSTEFISHTTHSQSGMCMEEPGSDCAIRRRVNEDGAWTFNVRNFMLLTLERSAALGLSRRGVVAEGSGMYLQLHLSCGRDSPRSAERRVHLRTSADSDQAPFAEMFAVVSQDVIAIFSESRSGASDDFLSLEPRR